jgi:hypothetical protein
MHHFLEDPSAITDFQHESKVEAFQLARLEDIQPDSTLGDSPENIDTEEEIQWGKDMQTYRREFLKKWRGEEGIGFVDDLGTGFIAPLIEDCLSSLFQPMVDYISVHNFLLIEWDDIRFFEISSTDEEAEDHGPKLCAIHRNGRR